MMPWDRMQKQLGELKSEKESFEQWRKSRDTENACLRQALADVEEYRDRPGLSASENMTEVQNIARKALAQSGVGG